MFFKTISVKEFYNLFLEFEPIKETMDIHVFDGLDMVIAEQCIAKEDFPPFVRACMDGYAVIAKDTFGASESNPVYLKVVGSIDIDKVPGFEINSQECARIVTGAPLPKGADAVAMIEYTEEISEDEIELRCTLSPGDNLILKGEDYKKGDVLLDKGTIVRPQEIGILMEFGITRVKMYRPVKVGIISTGNEIVSPSTDPLPLGKIRDVNSYALGAMIKKYRFHPIIYDIVPDQKKSLIRSISKALKECDVVLISGGSSIGIKDLTEEAITSFKDSHILCHGVGISPGKPTILAKIGNTPVIGLPGQVTSAQVVMHILILPFLRYLSNNKSYMSRYYFPYINAYLTHNVPSKRGREEYIRINICYEKDKILAKPIFSKSGLIKSLVKAQGFLKIPASSEGVLKGTQVEVLLI